MSDNNLLAIIAYDGEAQPEKYPGMTIVEDGAVFAPDLDFQTWSVMDDDWQRGETQLKRMTTKLQWVVGDWFNYGMDKFGEDMCSTVLDGLRWNTVREYGRLARMYARRPRELAPQTESGLTTELTTSDPCHTYGSDFDPTALISGKPVRRSGVDMGHHQAVAPLLVRGAPEAAVLILERAAEEHMTVKEVAAEVYNKVQEITYAHKPPPPEGQYRCIVVHPPWPDYHLPYKHEDATENYPTLRADTIEAEIDISEVADTETGCRVYLWVPAQFLRRGFALFDRWGVTYNGLFTHVRESGPTHKDYQQTTAHALYGTLGASAPLLQRGAATHFYHPREFYRRVVESTAGPRLDIYPSAVREGFEKWVPEITDPLGPLALSEGKGEGEA